MKIKISEIQIENFRAIKNSKIKLGDNNVLLGKNNIGKTSLLDVFSAFDNHLKITDVNIELLQKIMINKNNPERIEKNDCICLKVAYEWKDLNSDYWSLLSSISSSGKTVVLIKYSIPSENYSMLKEIDNVNDLINLFERQAWIGSEDDALKNRLTPLPSKVPLKKYLPLPKSDIDYVQKGELLLCPIMAFRYVDSGKNSNDEATANQFSTKISSMISDVNDVKETFEKIQKEIDDKVAPKMESFQDELKDFAYPRNPKNPLEAILTVDEWMRNPKVRIAQKFDDLAGFELPLRSQGLGYQNIYNIVARISALFSKMQKNDMHNPTLFAIEEPEAFTHPQLQHIFIQQISRFIKKEATKLKIPYQLLVISHSSEIATSAFENEFQLIIGRRENQSTHFINWDSIGANNSKSRDKLKKLIINYNAEMLFADKLIAYEGNSERLILISIIRNSVPNLLSEKIAFIPVGTAFNSIKDALVDLHYEKILLITDIDFKMDGQSGEPNDSSKVETTNGNLKYLINNKNDRSLNEINLSQCFEEKIDAITNSYTLTSDDTNYESINNNKFMITTQGFNSIYKFWPRTLESALVADSDKNKKMYLNSDLVNENIETTLSESPYKINLVEKELLKSGKGKADFALESLNLISEDGYTVPEYILKGLKWLDDGE